MRLTLESRLPAFTADRNARITTAYSGLFAIEMDDVGDGEYHEIITESEADELVGRGLRDARCL